MNRKMDHEKNFEMREIKFRAKRYGDKSWVYGNLYQGTKEGEQYSIILNDAGYHVAPQDDRNFAIAFFENEVNVVFPNTVGQYTGLKDKNGKEVYEGDILRIEEFKNESGPIEISEEFLRVFDLEDLKGEKQREYTTPVSWEDGAFVISVNRKGDTDLSALFGDMRLSFPIFVFEVIGNIYDNPELVEG